MNNDVTYVSRLSEPRKYTPRDKFTGIRYIMTLSEEDENKMLMYGRRLGVKGTITDLNTGKRYKIRGAACGLPNCQCDATAEEIPND